MKKRDIPLALLPRYSRTRTIFPVLFILIGLTPVLGALAQSNPNYLDQISAAAEQGDAQAQARLGVLYESGDGVSQDHGKARHWYTKAANQGDPVAPYNLGTLYSFGRGVAQDYVQARLWLAKAAEQGIATAQNHLATLYDQGRGGSKDYATVRKPGIGTPRPPSRDSLRRRPILPSFTC